MYSMHGRSLGPPVLVPVIESADERVPNAHSFLEQSFSTAPVCESTREGTVPANVYCLSMVLSRMSLNPLIAQNHGGSVIVRSVVSLTRLLLNKAQRSGLGPNKKSSLGVGRTQNRNGAKLPRS
jgi:hypothetical protein